MEQEMALDLLVKLLQGKKVDVKISDFDLTPSDLLECTCYQILYEIRDILRDDTNSDAECFQKIEDIVCALEKRGILCGPRHDFG